MSKALVNVTNAGSAIKWAGKFHDHLAIVSAETGRLVQFLPVYIKRVYPLIPELFVVVTRDPLVELCDSIRFPSHRDALDYIALNGVKDEFGEWVFVGGGIARDGYAEDMHLSHLRATQGPTSAQAMTV